MSSYLVSQKAQFLFWELSLTVSPNSTDIFKGELFLLSYKQFSLLVYHTIIYWRKDNKYCKCNLQKVLKINEMSNFSVPKYSKISVEKSR